MKLNKILRKSSNKYTLYFDNKKIDVYEDIILRYNLLNKKEFDDSLLDKIISDNNELIYYYKVLNFISYKERNECEVIQKLRTYHLNSNIIDNIISRIKDEGYLDKKRYIKAYIHDRVYLANDGPFKIKNDLLKMHYLEEEIDLLLNNIESDTWENKIKKIVDKKIKANHNKSQIMLINSLKKELTFLGYNSDYYDDILKNISIDDDLIREKEYQKLMKKYQNKYKDEKLDYIVECKLKEKGF